MGVALLSPVLDVQHRAIILRAHSHQEHDTMYSGNRSRRHVMRDAVALSAGATLTGAAPAVYT